MRRLLTNVSHSSNRGRSASQASTSRQSADSRSLLRRHMARKTFSGGIKKLARPMTAALALALALALLAGGSWRTARATAAGQPDAPQTVFTNSAPITIVDADL